jgi:hypothetical protein
MHLNDALRKNALGVPMNAALKGLLTIEGKD